MGLSRYISFPFNSGVNYEQFDFINGINTGESNYYYATYGHSNQNPSGIYRYSINTWQISNDIATVILNITGISNPRFAAGSMIRISGAAHGPLNYTGMIMEGGDNYVKFLAASYPTGGTSSGILTTLVSPGWTTQFYFNPSYTSSQDIETRTLESQFGDGYAQRQRDGINSNQGTWNLTFEGRTDKESKAIINFVEDKGGVDSFYALFGLSSLQNNSSIKYIASNPKLSTSSFNINSVSVVLKQSFD